MSAFALCLVLLAGLIHASWNIAAKKAGGDARFAVFCGLVSLLVWAPVGIWLGIDEVPRWGLAQWAMLGLSACVHSLYFVVLLRGYRKADLTVVYPLARGLGPLLSSLVAVLLLGERLSLWGALGLLGVVLGVFLIAGGPSLFRAPRDPASAARLRAGLVYGGLTGACIACYTVADGYSVKVLLISPIMFDYASNVVRMGLMGPTVLRNLPEAAVLWKRQWRYALIVGVLSPVSYVLVLYAVQTAPLSHVAPAREVSMLFAALLGGHLLGEGQRGSRLLGAGCIAVGVVALALG
nr:EamA family transporter [uncultured Albidiferax sp.]